MKIISEKKRIDSFSNAYNVRFNNNRSLINYKKLTNSVSGKLVISCLNNDYFNRFNNQIDESPSKINENT